MALRSLPQSNIPYQDRSTGGIFGSPVQPSGINQGSFNQRVLSPGLQALFEIEDAPPGYTVDDIIRDVVEAGGTVEDAKDVVSKVMPEEGSDYTEQDWQDSWAKSYNERMYDGGDAPAINTSTSSGDGSYFQDIPQDVEQRYPVAGGSGSDSLLGASPDYFRQQAEAGNDITPSLPFDSPQVMRQAENLSPVDVPGSAKGNTQVPTGRFTKEGSEIAGRLVDDLKKDFGLTDFQAQGAVANLAHESGGFNTMQEVSPTVKGSRGGYGYAQWTGPRRVEFEAYAKDNGLDIDSYEANYGFLKHELETTEKGSLQALKDTTNLRDATKTFEDKFERAGIVNMTSRNKWADVLSSSTLGSPQAQTTTPTSRPSLFDAPQVDYPDTPQSIREVHQQVDDALARMRDHDPRGDQVVATPGINGPQYHMDGVNGTTQKTTPQSYEQTLDQNLMLPGDLQPHQMPGTFYDPSMYNVAPIQPVGTESFTLPTEDDANVNYEMVDGARTDPMTSNQAQEMRPHAGSSGPVNRVGPSTNNFLSADDLQRYQEFMQPPTSRMDQFSYPEGPAAGRGTPQYGNTFELQNDRELHGATYGYPQVSTPSPATRSWGGDNEQQVSNSGYNAPINTYDTSRTYDNPTYRSDTSVGPGGSYSYGSTPRYEDYTYSVINPEWTKWSNAQSNANQLSYEEAAGLTEGSISSGVAGIEPVKEITKTGTREVESSGGKKTQSKPSGPRYSSKVMDIINRGQALPLANSQARQPFDIDMRKVGDAVKKGGVGGLLSGNPIAGAVIGGLFNAAQQTAPQLGGLFGNSYDGMFIGGDVPALSRGVQLGGAYDVYADRSGRNTWAVSNGDSIVSRDGGTGWTGVTSNVNGNGPVTTLTLQDGGQASPFPGFGGILNSEDDGSDRAAAGGGSGAASYGGATDTSGTGTAMGGGASGGGGSGGEEEDKIVCTAMNHSYGFGGFRNAIWLKYAKDNLTPYHQTGYHALFLPLVNLGYKKNNKFVRSILEHIARHRSVDLRAEMKGSKRDTLGRIYRAILEPTCYLVGRMIGDKK